LAVHRAVARVCGREGGAERRQLGKQGNRQKNGKRKGDRTKKQPHADNYITQNNRVKRKSNAANKQCYDSSSERRPLRARGDDSHRSILSRENAAVSLPEIQTRTQFTRENIIDDYRIAVQSRHASLIGRTEALTGKAKFGIFGDGKEVAQLAWARAFRRGDWRSGYYRDQTFMLALGAGTLDEFFAQLYADADV